MNRIPDKTVKSSNRLIHSLVSAVIDAQNVLDSNHAMAQRRIEKDALTLAPSGRLNLEGMGDVASALTPVHLSIVNTRVQARVYFSQTERKGGRVGIGIVATPIEAYYEASFGSTKETESSIQLEIQQVPLAHLTGREIEGSDS